MATKWRKDLHKSAGILEDHTTRKFMATREGTITKVPDHENDIVNKKYADGIATRSVINLFLTENASDIGGYFDLETNVITAAKENIVQSITANSMTLIASFASILDDGEIDAIALLESGVYALHLHAEAAVAKNLFFYFEFYHRTAGGAETLLGTSHDSGELTTSEGAYDTHATIASDKSFVSGDRIVIKVYGRNNSAAARNVIIYMEGDTASRVEFPGFVSLSNFVLKSGDTMTGDLIMDGANISMDFGDFVSEVNPDGADAIRIKGTDYVDVVIGGMTGLFAVWNVADTIPVFFVNERGDLDIARDFTAAGNVSCASANISTNGKLEFRDTGLFIQSTSDGNLLIEADTMLTLGKSGSDIEIGDSTQISLRTETDTKVDVGEASKRFRKGFFSGIVKVEGGIITMISTDNVSDPPTDAQLDTAFGTPVALGPGFIGILDDNSANLDVWLCYTSDTSWFYLQGTKAV